MTPVTILSMRTEQVFEIFVLIPVFSNVTLAHLVNSMISMPGSPRVIPVSTFITVTFALTPGACGLSSTFPIFMIVSHFRQYLHIPPPRAPLGAFSTLHGAVDHWNMIQSGRDCFDNESGLYCADNTCDACSIIIPMNYEKNLQCNSLG